MKNHQRLFSAAVAFAGLAFTSICSASSIKTSDVSGSVNANIYTTRGDVFLNGTDFEPGIYFYRVTDPSGSVILYPDAYRTLTVDDSRTISMVALAPFEYTPNRGEEYKVQVSSTTDFGGSSTKSDNFKVRAAVIPPPVTPPPAPADTLAPVITANNLTVSAGANCATNVYFNATATDNLDGNVTVTYTTGTPAVAVTTGSNYSVGSYIITAQAKDAAGNTAQKDFTVIVVDDTPPAIATLSNKTVSTSAGLCSAPVTFSVTASDNCGMSSVIAVPASGSVFPKGTTTVLVTATDLAGNVSTGSFTVTVQDQEAPVVACVQTTNPSAKNIPTAGATAGNSGQNPDGFYQLSGKDNCDGTNLVLYVKDSASGFIAGPFTNLSKIKLIQATGATPNQKPMTGYTQIQLKGDGILTATDAAGNVATCNCLVPSFPK